MFDPNREALIDAMAEAMPRPLDPSPLNREARRLTAEHILDALLATPGWEPCPTCRGTGRVESYDANHGRQWFACRDCTDGFVSSSVPAVMWLAGERVGWCEAPAYTTHGYVLNIERVREDSAPVFRARTAAEEEARGRDAR